MIDIFLLLSCLLPSIVSVNCLSRKIQMLASRPRFENSVCWWIIHTSWQACLPDVFSPPTVISVTFPPAFRLSRLATCLLGFAVGGGGGLLPLRAFPPLLFPERSCTPPTHHHHPPSHLLRPPPRWLLYRSTEGGAPHPPLRGLLLLRHIHLHALL